MSIDSIRPVRTFILSGLLAGVCLATLLIFDIRFGSQEILYQFNYGSKKEILIQLIENGLYLFVLMFGSTFFTQLLYRAAKSLGRIAIFCSLILAFFILKFSLLLTGIFCVYWLINLFFIRGARL